MPELQLCLGCLRVCLKLSYMESHSVNSGRDPVDCVSPGKSKVRATLDSLYVVMNDGSPSDLYGGLNVLQSYKWSGYR